MSGPCEGASISEVNHSPNDDPKGCSGTGVGRVDTDYSTIFIKGCGNEDISCVGGGFQTFSPGLKTNPKTIYSRKWSHSEILILLIKEVWLHISNLIA